MNTTFEKLAKLVTTLIALSTPIFSTGFDYSDDEFEDEESAIIATDTYDFRAVLSVPQVINNTESLGERKFQNQIIKGNFYVNWHEDGSHSFGFDNLSNTRFRVGGKYVTYEGFVDYDKSFPRFSWIGSNKKKLFKTPTLAIDIVFEPSYAISEITEDNSFYLSLSGKGTSIVRNGSRIAKTIRGKVAGKQGCSCADYGHISPTRAAGIDGPTDSVTDVVETEGTWRIIWKKRTYFK